MALETSEIRRTESSLEESNIVTWNVGDTWKYDIELDAVISVSYTHLRAHET